MVSSYDYYATSHFAHNIDLPDRYAKNDNLIRVTSFSELIRDAGFYFEFVFYETLTQISGGSNTRDSYNRSQLNAATIFSGNTPPGIARGKEDPEYQQLYNAWREMKQTVEHGAKRAAEAWYKETEKKLEQQAKKTNPKGQIQLNIQLANVAKITTQTYAEKVGQEILGDIEVIVNGVTYHLELKYQTNINANQADLRYFGPVSDQTLFGADNYWKFLQDNKKKYLTHTQPERTWIQAVSYVGLQEFLSTKFSSSSEMFRYLLLKGGVNIGTSSAQMKKILKSKSVVHSYAGEFTFYNLEKLAKIFDRETSGATGMLSNMSRYGGSMKKGFMMQDNSGNDLASFGISKYDKSETDSNGIDDIADISFAMYFTQRLLNQVSTMR